MFRQVMVMVVLLCAAEAFAAAPPTSGRDCHGDPLLRAVFYGRYALTWSDRVPHQQRRAGDVDDGRVRAGRLGVPPHRPLGDDWIENDWRRLARRLWKRRAK